jgi:hypothetical protein
MKRKHNAVNSSKETVRGIIRLGNVAPESVTRVTMVTTIFWEETHNNDWQNLTDVSEKYIAFFPMAEI